MVARGAIGRWDQASSVLRVLHVGQEVLTQTHAESFWDQDLARNFKDLVFLLHFFEKTIRLLHNVVGLVHLLTLLPLLLVVSLEGFQET